MIDLGCLSICMFVSQSVGRFLQFVLVSYYAAKINACQYDENVHGKKQHASSIRTIPSKNTAFIQVFFFESSNSMQYRSLLFNCIHVY